MFYGFCFLYHFFWFFHFGFGFALIKSQIIMRIYL